MNLVFCTCAVLHQKGWGINDRTGVLMVSVEEIIWILGSREGDRLIQSCFHFLILSSSMARTIFSFCQISMHIIAFFRILLFLCALSNLIFLIFYSTSPRRARGTTQIGKVALG